jgi:hypothetical protein
LNERTKKSLEDVVQSVAWDTAVNPAQLQANPQITGLAKDIKSMHKVLSGLLQMDSIKIIFSNVFKHGVSAFENAYLI